MTLRITCSPLFHLLKCSALAMVVMGASRASASTVWNGPLTNYVQSQPYTPSDPNSVDNLTALVALTRTSSAGIFNLVDETSYDVGSDLDPTDTEWAVGSLDQYASLTYGTWAEAGDGHPVLNLVGVQLVVHLITDDIYLSAVFTQLGGHGAGGFGYLRSTPGAAAPTPTVSITSPTNGATFAARASVAMMASASVSSGTVTNVGFFAGGTLLGSAQTSPFSFTVSNLAAGDYSLTAVATAAGVSATSAAVNISVVSPVAVSISNPSIAGGRFSFDYTANPGLTYVIESSSNLLHWAPIATNVASTNSVYFTDPTGLGLLRFYEVVRQSNP